MKQGNLPSSIPVLSTTGFLTNVVDDGYACLSSDPEVNKEKMGDLCTLEQRFLSEGFTFVSVVLPRLGKAILKSFQTGMLEMPANLKRKAGTKLPRLFYRMLQQLYEDDGKLKYNFHLPDSVRLHAALQQICFLFQKTEMPGNQHLKKKALQAWIEDEKYLKSIRREIRRCVATSDPILHIAKGLVTRIFSNFEKNINELEMIPRNGPGSTAEHHQSSKAKFDELHFSGLPNGTEGWFDRLYFEVPSYANSIRGKKARNAYVRWFDRTNEPVVRITAVPKNSTKMRTIGMEPTAMMFLQQGLKQALYDYIEACPITSTYINFTHQEVNQKLALLGSATGALSTIDWSSASDLIHKSLVWYLFSGVPLLRDMLFALRTPKAYIKVDRTHEYLVNVEKYAQMGSALCFPVMSVVFFTLFKAVAIAYNEKTSEIRTSFPHIKGNMRKLEEQVWVYGDDCVCYKGLAKKVMRALPRYGLKPSEGKCFTEGPFRESCGVDVLVGKRNIRPIFVKKQQHIDSRVDQWTDDATLVVAFINLRNDFYRAGYASTVSYLDSVFLQGTHGKFTVQYAPEGCADFMLCFEQAATDEEIDHFDTIAVDQFLGCFAPGEINNIKNTHCPDRLIGNTSNTPTWNYDLQRYEIPVLCLKPSENVKDKPRPWDRLFVNITTGCPGYELSDEELRKSIGKGRPVRNVILSTACMPYPFSPQYGGKDYTESEISQAMPGIREHLVKHVFSNLSLLPRGIRISE